jgi:FkbM family methyltransferase
MKDIPNIEFFDIIYNHNEIKVNTHDLNYYFSENQLPLKFEFVRKINKKLLWSCELNSNSWATFPDTEMVDVIVKTNTGNIIWEKKWSLFEHGSLFYRKLYLYLKNRLDNGLLNNGVVVGTHKGEFGEWIPPLIDNLSNITLVEAESNLFEHLNKNYQNFKNVKLINSLVTTDGSEAIFYYGGEGYTNSVKKDVIEYWETEEIKSKKMKSISFDDLIDNNVNWIHLDVEGIDNELIMSLNDNKLNQIQFIIFEYNNLSTDDREIIDNFLIKKGFKTIRYGGICLANK